MNSSFNGHCPLCESEAIYFLDDHENIKRYKCKVCNRLNVSRHAERLLSGDFSGRREELSSLAASLCEKEALEITYALENEKVVIKHQVVPI